MRDTAAEPFGSWIAKRITIAIVVFVLWSWFVTSPMSAGGAIRKTGEAWCAAFPCATDETEGDTVEAGIKATGDAAVATVLELHQIVEQAQGRGDEEGDSP
ncbi:MAG: hypothetical protein AAF962_03125 [Actinomycetota bacterium]